MNTLTVKFQNFAAEEGQAPVPAEQKIYPISSHETSPGYAPAALLDALRRKAGLTSDAALSRALMISAPVISKVRHRHLPLTNNHLVRMHDVMGLSIAELRKMMGVQS